MGAGAAGLAAARELHRAGIGAIILEASDRPGGRIRTIHDPQTAVPVELGAEFVHGLHPALWTLLREMRVPVVELGGAHWTRTSRGFHPAGDEWDGISRIFAEMSRAPEQTFARFINGVHAPDDVKSAAVSFIEGFNASNRNEVSVDWLNAEQRASREIDGDRSFRVLTGYGGVALHLARGLDIRFGSPVSEIRWQPGEVRVVTREATFRAARCIVTAPFAVLQQARLRLEPEPPALKAAREAIVTGDAIRMTFRFSEAAWTKAAPDISFIHGDADFPVWWTAYPVQRPVITGWAAGPKADRLQDASEEELKQTALQSLRNLLGEDPGQPEQSWFHDWRRDPFSLGAYSSVRAGGMAAHARLREPVENTLWFAGEAVATGHMGTVHGAIASGIQAARGIAGQIR